jgi:large subunit ribosomal protein L10
LDNPRSEKVAVVDEVRQRFDDASAAILTEYRGLKVKDLAGLRRTLRASGGEYKIYKNTLVRLAARDSGFADLEGMLVGPTAIAFVDGDAAAVAKALRDFARTNPLLIIKGGVLGDRVMDARETTALADLPPRDVLLARFAGALAAPMQQLAGLLQALPRNLAYGLAALRDQRAEGGTAATADTGAAATEGPSEAESAAADEAPAGADEAPAAANVAPAAANVAPAADSTAPPADAAADSAAEAATDADAGAGAGAAQSTESESPESESPESESPESPGS